MEPKAQRWRNEPEQNAMSRNKRDESAAARPEPCRNMSQTCEARRRFIQRVREAPSLHVPPNISFYGAKRRAQMSSPNIAGWYARLCMANLRLTYEQDATPPFLSS